MSAQLIGQFCKEVDGLVRTGHALAKRVANRDCGYVQGRVATPLGSVGNADTSAVKLLSVADVADAWTITECSR